jgi:hypothetical protein
LLATADDGETSIAAVTTAESAIIAPGLALAYQPPHLHGAGFR